MEPSITHHNAPSVFEQPDVIEDADDEDVFGDEDIFADICVHLTMDIDDSTPATQPTFLGDYDLDDSPELRASDYDSDLEPPPLAQKPTSHSIFPDFDSPVASQKCKISPLRDDDDLLTSSEVEIVEGTKNEPTEPVPTRCLTSAVHFCFLMVYFTDLNMLD